jgi:hypothetical protein
VFEPTERILGMVDELYALTVPLDRGDILPHEDISRVLGCEPHTEHYQWCLEKLRERLREGRGIAINNEREIGYRLLPRNDQLHVPLVRRFRRAVRQVRKARKDIGCLPTVGLSDHQRVVMNHRLDQCQEMERDLKRQLRDRERIGRPTPVNPRLGA